MLTARPLFPWIGGKVEGLTFGTSTTDGPRLNLLRMEEDLSAAHLRLSQTVIEHLNWPDCVTRYDRLHTLFFCDPPYYGTEGYGVEFGLDQYAKLADLARSIKGHMVITVNDIPEMREVFSGFNIQTVSIRYSVGGGSRGSSSNELIIRNRG